MFLSLLFLILSLPLAAERPGQQTMNTSGMAQQLPYHEARLASHPLRLMLARGTDEKTKGLMFFTTLEPDTGMLFVYPESQRMVFWMKNTLIPLDLVFFNDQLRVTEWIESMQPGGNQSDRLLPRYASRGSARYALELAAGSVQRLDIQTGQKLEIPLTLLFCSEP